MHHSSFSQISSLIWCQNFQLCHNSHWKSSFHYAVRILLSFLGHTHKAQGRGKLMEKTLHRYFLHYLQSGGRQKSSVFRIAVTLVFHAFLIPILDCSNLSCVSQLWGPAGAERGHTSHLKRARAMPCLASCTSYTFASKWSRVDAF